MTARQKSKLPDDLVTYRKKKGISLNQIAAVTKIGSHYLEAIERGQFHKLPDGVYRLSYVRQYARAIEYDENKLVKYCSEVAAPNA